MARRTRTQNQVAGYVVVLDEPHATSVLLMDATFVTLGRLFLPSSARPPVRVFRTAADAYQQAASWPADVPLAVLAVSGDGALWRLRRRDRAELAAAPSVL